MSDTEGHISISTPDGPMPSFEAFPSGPAKGGVLVVQEAFGVTPHIEDIARRLAQSGWHAVAPAFFHRQGAPVFAYDDLESVMPVMQELTAEGIVTDVGATLEHIGSDGTVPEHMGVVGFCMGGSVAFHTAATRKLGAAVTFYGGGVSAGRFGFPPLIDLAPDLKTPWLGLYGDLDQGIPSSEVEDLRLAAEAAPVPTNVVLYPEAAHGFNCNDRPAAFNASAAANAWKRTLDWFDQHMGIHAAD